MTTIEGHEEPQGQPHVAVLFSLPDGNIDEIQARFFEDRDFWQPHLARLILWTKPLALTRTEAPDGQPALAFIVEYTEFEDILYQVARSIAEQLDLPAFAMTIVYVDDAMKEDLLSSDHPWD